MRASHDFRFDASSPVGRHWLIHGVGFTVCDSGGQKLGIVEDIDVDPLQHRAARVLVRRRGLFPRPRYVAIDSRAVESVLPGPRLFFVAAAEEHTSPAAHATATERVRGLARASRPPLAELDRRLAAAVGVALRLSRRGATAGAEATVRTAGRTRREAPRLAAWLTARAREAGHVTLTMLRVLLASARSAGRLLADLAVLAAVAVVAAWRKAAAGAKKPMPLESDPPDPGEPRWRRDADAPLARDTRRGTMRPTGRRRPEGSRSERPSRRR